MCRSFAFAVVVRDRRGRKSAAEHTAAPATAAPAADIAHKNIHPERQAEASGVAAGLCIRLLITGVGLPGVLQLVKQILVCVVVRFYRNSCARFVTGPDVVAQSLVGQSAIIMPLGIAFIGGNPVQRVHGFLIETVADIIGRGPHFGAFLAGCIGLAAPGSTIETKAKRAKTKSAKRILLVLVAVSGLTIAVGALLLLIALIPGLPAALFTAHNLAVSRLDFFEFFFSGRVVGVQVGMILLAFLAISLFYGFIIGRLPPRENRGAKARQRT